MALIFLPCSCDCRSVRAKRILGLKNINGERPRAHGPRVLGCRAKRMLCTKRKNKPMQLLSGGTYLAAPRRCCLLPQPAVYALGLYVDAHGAKKALSKWKGSSGDALVKNQAAFDGGTLARHRILLCWDGRGPSGGCTGAGLPASLQQAAAVDAWLQLSWNG